MELEGLNINGITVLGEAGSGIFSCPHKSPQHISSVQVNSLPSPCRQLGQQKLKTQYADGDPSGALWGT